MANKKNLSDYNDYDELQVKLKKICGIEPSIYLTVLYLLALILIIFFTFFLPGIIKYGSKININSTPSGASIWINGVYAGATPTTLFIEKGETEIVLQKKGYKYFGEVLPVKGQLFSTLFRRAAITFDKKLQIKDYKELYNWILEDFLRWTTVEDFYESYQPPQLLAKTLGDLPKGGKENKYTYNFLEKSFKNITNTYLISDYIQAAFIYANSGNPMLPHDTINFLSSFLAKTTENPAILYHIYYILKNSNTLPFLKSIDMEKLGINIKNSLDNKNEANLTPLSVSTGRMIFSRKQYFTFSAGKYLSGNNNKNNIILAPEVERNVELGEFSIAADKINNIEFFNFVSANPDWTKDNLELLIDNAFVTEDYLSHWPTNKPLEADYYKPVNNISFYAAEAYCKWLTEINNGQYIVTLPDEYMWEAAMRDQNNSMKNALGVLWDWCYNWFNVADYVNPSTYFSAQEGIAPLNGIEKSVRGGSWANQKDEINVWTRGSQPPNWCTPFIGFRTAIVRRAEN